MSEPKHTVLVCESQPVTAEGLRSLLGACPDIELTAVVHSIGAAMDRLRLSPPSVLILDKAFGAYALLECLEFLIAAGLPTATVIWAVSMTEAEALRYAQAGAKGVLSKTSDPPALLACLRAVASGAGWMDQWPGAQARRSPALTPRERQVLELIEQGLKNREIGLELGIRPGTVKVHLKHIFEKTGIRTRYGLALSGLAAKRASVPVPAGGTAPVSV